MRLLIGALSALTLTVFAGQAQAQCDDGEMVIKFSHVVADKGHPKGGQVVIEKALDGLGIPLHPGAERYYREAGILK